MATKEHSMDRETQGLRVQLDQLKIKVKSQESEMIGLKRDHQTECEAHNSTKARLEETKTELTVVKRQLEYFQNQQMSRINVARKSAMNAYQVAYDRNNPGASYDYSGGATGGDVPDSGQDRMFRRADSSDSVDSGVSDDNFECPSCSRLFDVNDPESYTAHTESCEP